MFSNFKYFFASAVFLISLSCKNDESEVIIPIENIVVDFEQPTNFPKPTYEFSENPFSQEKFTLGKRLFYDGILSLNGQVSCATCHNQQDAFTHHGHALSDGVGGKFGTRNAQPIQNLAFMKDFTWDGGIRNLDLQPLIPIESEVEMNESIFNVLDKLKANEEYQNLFDKAFVKKETESHIINIRTLTQALSQFMNALVSANSRYDHYIRNEPMQIPYSEDEIEGLAIFEQKCASCHAGALFTDQSYRNNGLTATEKFPDELGRGRVNNEDAGRNSADYYKFKVPSLRNVWVTLPYMHDGRMATINDVLEHYNSGVQNTKNLDPLLQQNGNLGIPLSNEEKRLLKIFLKSLTDTKFLNDERFSKH